jgi:hypothetical protein
MNCLESFSFYSSGNDGIGSFEGLQSWGTTASNGWIVNSLGSSSQYNIEGFKNINVYGIDVIGFVGAKTGGNLGGIVTDWAFTLQVEGTVPQVSGTITPSPNYFAISTSSANLDNVVLSKMNPSIRFSSPVQSVKSIIIDELYATGTHLETLGSLRLAWSVTFVVYYKYEGEDLAFL